MSVQLSSRTVAAPTGRIPMTAAAFSELEAEIGSLTASILETRTAALGAQDGADQETARIARPSYTSIGYQVARHWLGATVAPDKARQTAMRRLRDRVILPPSGHC